MKRWFLLGAAAVLAGGWTSAAGAQSSPEGVWEQHVVVEEMPLAEDMMAEMVPAVDVWMAEEPAGDVLMEVAQGGPGEGPPEGGMMMRHGGPGMMGPGGPPMMQRRVMRFRGRQMGMMGMMGGPMMLERARKALGLTDEQVNRLHDLRMASKKDRIRIGADAQIARMELEDALQQPNPRPEDVRAKVAAVNAARGQMLEKMVNARLEMKKVFTPEQQEKMRNMMMQRMGGGWGHGEGGGGGRGWGGGQQWKSKEEPKGEPKK
ncbi:MAG: hypothetical protein EXS64_07435 [Candidatus Latescibacteria bacterium]|nr:hypothetical protein [Candidatus Latescibacterota bacterium]